MKQLSAFLLALSLAMALGGCGEKEVVVTATPTNTPVVVVVTATPSVTPTPVPTPTSTPTPVPTQTPTPAAIPRGLNAKVLRVIDGDTFEAVMSDGSSITVRLLGVDTPEIYSQNKPYEYGNVTDITCLNEWGDKATQFARQQLDG